MQINFTDEEIEVTATIAQLREMDHFEQKVYGTPNDAETRINQAYVAARPSWQSDRVVARLSDFLEEEGWDSLSDDPESDDPNQIVTIRKSRAI